MVKIYNKALAAPRDSPGGLGKGRGSEKKRVRTHAKLTPVKVMKLPESECRGQITVSLWHNWSIYTETGHSLIIYISIDKSTVAYPVFQVNICSVNVHHTVQAWSRSSVTMTNLVQMVPQLRLV